jgi:peptidoglycan/xylan/chitin deacetylase (PgdA/CDA1 family)
MINRVFEFSDLVAPQIIAETLLRLACRFGCGIVINYHTLSRVETLAQVKFLGRYFDFIAHDELIPRLTRPRPRPFCLLTFDDGKKSNASETAPVLRQLGVPAAFYVPTGFVSQCTQPLWFDRYFALCAQVPNLPSELSLDMLKRLPQQLRDQYVNQACHRYGIDADISRDDVRPMSWHDVRDLHAQSFTIGSHSEWHAILPIETTEEAQNDIARSIRRVSWELGSRCTSFSFPNGSYTRSLALFAQACGVDTVFTTEPLWVGPQSESWRLPRVQLFAGRSAAYLTFKAAAARLPGLLRNPDGSRRAYVRLGHIARR